MSNEYSFEVLVTTAPNSGLSVNLAPYFTEKIEIIHLKAGSDMAEARYKLPPIEDPENTAVDVTVDFGSEFNYCSYS